ncbi:MAG: TAXI family TRAP transporter solute-binding subunit [Tepidimonas sp.]|uniref:TAXI family TRAP transporter solute-binding subunit n=1 Tax=Tepidimonas sp. TaxID=2002775 RepID=UPI0040552F70
MVAGSAAAQTTQFINVLTGGQSGVYYPVGVALPQIDAKETPNARSTVQVIRDSAVNLNLLQSGHGEATFTLADALSDAWLGNEEAGFKQTKARPPAAFGLSLRDQRHAASGRCVRSPVRMAPCPNDAAWRRGALARLPSEVVGSSRN